MSSVATQPTPRGPPQTIALTHYWRQQPAAWACCRPHDRRSAVCVNHPTFDARRTAAAQSAKKRGRRAWSAARWPLALPIVSPFVWCLYPAAQRRRCRAGCQRDRALVGRRLRERRPHRPGNSIFRRPTQPSTTGRLGRVWQHPGNKPWPHAPYLRATCALSCPEYLSCTALL